MNVENVESVDLSTLDRGDNLGEVATPDAAAVEKAAANEAAVAEELAKTTPEAPAAEAEPEPVRDPATGKFTKKERDEDPMVVPKARFDEQVNKERAARIAAEQRLNDLQAKIDQATHSIDVSQLETDIVGLEKQYAKLMMEGEAEKAADVMAEVRHKTEQMRDLRFTQERAKETAEQFQQRQIDEEKARVNDVIVSLEKAYPEFDEKSEQFNTKLVNFVLAEQNRLIHEEGMTPSMALQHAADELMDIRGTKSTLAAAQDVGGKDVAAERKAEAVRKGIAVAKSQPGSMKEVGIDSDKAGSTRPENEDAAKMTFEEFSALPESTKAKMRGDYI